MASELLLINPKRRKKRKTTPKKRRSYKKRRPVAKKRRTYRRNPSGRGAMGKMMAMAMPAFQGAAGAVLLDLAFGFIPLPVQLKVGPMRHLSKVLGAVALGTVVSNFTRGKMGANMATGAMTVAFHGALREFTQNIPGLQFGAYEELAYYSPGQIVNNGVGEYVDGVGYGEGDVSYEAYGAQMGEYV